MTHEGAYSAHYRVFCTLFILRLSCMKVLFFSIAMGLFFRMALPPSISPSLHPPLSHSLSTVVYHYELAGGWDARPKCIYTRTRFSGRRTRPSTSFFLFSPRNSRWQTDPLDPTCTGATLFPKKSRLLSEHASGKSTQMHVAHRRTCPAIQGPEYPRKIDCDQVESSPSLCSRWLLIIREFWALCEILNFGPYFGERV